MEDQQLDSGSAPAALPPGKPIVSPQATILQLVPDPEEGSLQPTLSPPPNPAQNPPSQSEVQEQQVQEQAEITLEYEKKDDDLSFYRKLIDSVHNSISNESPDPKEPRCKLGLCCCAIDCFAKCRCGEKRKPFTIVNNMSPVLRRGRSKGWLIHRNIVFPLVSPIIRTMWVVGELIILFVALGLSIARFSCGNIHIFNIVHLALTIFASVLGTFDVIVLFCGYDFKKCGCSATTQEYDPENKRCKGQCCREFTRDAFDVGRMVLSELIFYPLLICAMFDTITSEAYYFDTEAKRITFILFLTSAILMLVFVYVVRIAVPISAIGKLRRRRAVDGITIDGSNAKSAAHIQNFFVLHTIGQMIVQMVMIATVGILTHNENIHLIEDCRYDETVHVSGYLWCMLVSGYVLPTLGLFSFSLMTYYWLLEFPIGICIDFLLNLNLKKSEMEKREQKLNDIVGHLNFLSLRRSLRSFIKQLGVVSFCTHFKVH